MTQEPLSDEMVQAVIAEDVALIATLLDSGQDVNACNERRETAFSFACAHDALRSARYLVARGADMNTVDIGGGSPLDWAVCWSSPEFREWLIAVGGRRHDTSYEPWSWPRGGDCQTNDERGDHNAT